MRILNRIKETLYYAKFQGKVEITEMIGTDEIRTGDYTLSYGEVGEAQVYISTPKVGYYAVSGEAKVGGEGVTTGYRHTIISEKDLGLTEEDIMWVGDPAVYEAVKNGFTLDGETMTADGVSYTQRVFQIVAIQPSYHHITYSVKEI